MILLIGAVRSFIEKAIYDSMQYCSPRFSLWVALIPQALWACSERSLIKINIKPRGTDWCLVIYCSSGGLRLNSFTEALYSGTFANWTCKFGE